MRLLLPNTHQVVTITNCSTIPCNRWPPGRSPEVDTRKIPIQQFQHVRLLNTPSNGGSAFETPSRPRGQADRSPQTISRPSALATGGEGVYQQRCQTRVLEAVPVGEPPVTGVIEWSRLGRKTACPDAQWTCRCSTNMLSVKHITPNPRFIRQRWYLLGPRRLSSVLGTGITVCQSEIATSPRSSSRGVGTDTKLIHGATLRHKTDTPEYSTSLSRTFPTNPIASMTYAYGQTLSKKFSFKHVVSRHLRSTRNYAETQTFAIGSDTMEFAGFVITPTNIQPSDKHYCAICDFPRPQNITDIQFWFGLINQV